MILLSDYLKINGGFHDVEVINLSWNTIERQLTLVSPDLNTNLTDLPEYPGEAPGKMIFSEVTELDISVSTGPDTPLWIYDLEQREDHGATSITLGFSPGGKIVAKCQRVDIELEDRHPANSR